MSNSPNNSNPEILEKISNLRPAIFVDEKFLGGEVEIVRHLLTGFSDMSCQSLVISSPGKIYQDLANGPYQLTEYPAFKLPFMWKRNRDILLNFLNDFKPNILHCFSVSRSKLVADISKQLDIPYVVNVNRTDGRPYVLQRFCQKVICPSQCIYLHFSSKKTKYANNLEVVNYSTFVEQTTSCFDFSNKLSTMILVSDFTNLKKLEPLLNAIRHLAIDGYEFIFFLIGSGRSEPKIRRLIKSLGLNNVVNVVPPMHPMRDILKEGDIFVQPELKKCFNPILLEAMSVGMAVAGCKGGVDDLMTKDETASIFDPDDELSIYSALQELLDKKEKARQLAKNAQANLRKNYSVSTMVDSFLNIYKDAINNFK